MRNGLTGIVGGSACDKPLASQDDLNNKECVKKERLLKVRGEAMDVSVLLFGVWSCENFYIYVYSDIYVLFVRIYICAFV